MVDLPRIKSVKTRKKAKNSGSLKKKFFITIGVLLILVAVIFSLFYFDFFKTEVSENKFYLKEDFSLSESIFKNQEEFDLDKVMKDGNYYITANSTGKCQWDEASIIFPESFNLEVISTWIEGSKNSYGIMLMEDPDNSAMFLVRADGAARFILRKNKENVVIKSWEADKALVSEGTVSNTQRIEVKNGKFRYIVNANLICDGDLEGIKLEKIGLRVCDNQKVCFKEITLEDTKAQKLMYVESFDTKGYFDWKPGKRLNFKTVKIDRFYLFETNNETGECYGSTIPLKLNESKYEINVSGMWKGGDNRPYWFCLKKNSLNYVNFMLKKNGEARFWGVENGTYNLKNEYVMTPYVGNLKAVHNQKVILSKDKIEYFVNDFLVGVFENHTLFPINEMELKVCGTQIVVYNLVEIKEY